MNSKKLPTTKEGPKGEGHSQDHYSDPTARSITTSANKLATTAKPPTPTITALAATPTTSGSEVENEASGDTADGD